MRKPNWLLLDQFFPPPDPKYPMMSARDGGFQVVEIPAPRFLLQKLKAYYINSIRCDFQRDRSALVPAPFHFVPAQLFLEVGASYRRAAKDAPIKIPGAAACPPSGGNGGRMEECRTGVGIY